jgi:hypothetical protein
MDSKLANEGRKALIAAAKRLTREERLRAFTRHSKLVTALSDAAKRALAKSRGGSGTMSSKTVWTCWWAYGLLSDLDCNLDSGLEMD